MAQRSRLAQPGARVGSQTTPVAPSPRPSSTGRVIAPRSLLTRDVRRRSRQPRRCCGLTPATGGAGGGQQVRLAGHGASCRRVPSARWRARPGCRRARPARRPRSRGRGRAGPPRRPARRARPGPAAAVRKPRSRAEAVGQRGQHPQVAHRARRFAITASKAAVAALPVHEGARLAPRISETGKHHVGPLGDRGGAGLQADHEADLLQPLQRGLRIERSRSGRRRPRSARRARASPATDQHLVGVATLSRTAASRDPPGRLGVDPGGRVGHRPAAGQQVGQAAGLDRTAVARAARHPGEPRAGALGQPLSTAVSVPDDRRPARRPGSPSRRRGTSARMIRSPAASASALGLGARARWRPGWRPCLRAPLLRYGARVQDRRPFLRNALRSRRKIAPASSSGSKADQQHPDGVSRDRRS